MAPVENQKTNIESIIPLDVQKRLTDLQKDIESSKNIDANMKTVFDILDGLAEQHPTDLELKRSYEDIKTYFRYRAYVRYLANANAVLADTKAKQGQVL